MCTQNQLELITRCVAAKSKETIKDKLITVILYGSYARGDYDRDSDIDIMVLADIPKDECWEYNVQLIENLVDVELENEVVISVTVVSNDVFEQYRNVLPFYKNVSKEGIKIA